MECLLCAAHHQLENAMQNKTHFLPSRSISDYISSSLKALNDSYDLENDI